MNSKRFIRLSLCLTLILLILVAGVQIAVDPLFQYHTPWFGMKPVIINDRYQNAGVAKNFDFDNVIIGNSLSENYKVSDVSNAFGGETVKLTASGSHALDWTYILSILNKKDSAPKHILINMDPYIFNASPTELKHELPEYLYDRDYFNDVKYLYNFSVIKDFTYDAIKRNKNNRIPNYDSFMLWSDDFEYGKDFVLSHYNRPKVSTETLYSDDTEDYCNNIDQNLSLLFPFIEGMSDTEFVFFFSPFSMLFWDMEMRENGVEKQKAGYLKACEILSAYDNVSLYLWTDNDMLDVMGDLNNYCDEAHYSPKVCEMMAERIGKKEGIIIRETYKEEINKLFDYIENYDYEKLFV